MIAKCPYCSVALDPPPKRKKNCPNCSNFIYVRNRKLLTEFDALKQDWLLYLSPINVSSGDFDHAKAQLTHQFGHVPGFYDVVWRILNDIITPRRSSADIEIAYREMARVASFEQKDPRPYLAQALTTSLQAMKKRGIKRVIIYSYGGEPDFSTCEACRSLHGKELFIDEALVTLPIPNMCTHDTGCRCEYQPV